MAGKNSVTVSFRFKHIVSRSMSLVHGMEDATLSQKYYCSKHIVQWVVGSIIHDRLIELFLFSFQPVLHDWCNKGCGMCYPICGMMHIKEPLLLIRKSSRFPLALFEWSFTICLTPYNRKQNVLSVSLNKTVLSFLTEPEVRILYISMFI